jgi:DNA-directed RNA polymerase specialized sigma24 family protein
MTFPNTRWTLIAKLGSPERRDDALSVLCRDYWRPVYSFLRRFGKNHEDAEDSCQAFFANVLRLDLFSRADGERGRLRTFLLGALEKFLGNEHRGGAALKRGGGTRVMVALDDPAVCGELGRMAAECATPAEAFDGAWLSLLMERAVCGIRSQYEAQGKGALFAALFPALMDHTSAPQEAQAKAAGVSVSNFRVQLHRLRTRYRNVLLEELAATLGDGADSEAELAWLFSISERRV